MLINELTMPMEAPKKPRPTVRDPLGDYEEQGKTKTTKINSPADIDKVILYLQGNESGKITKMGKTLAKMKTIADEFKKEEEEFKQFTRDYADEMFPSSDDFYTRIIETASLTLKIGKAEAATSKEVFDADGMISDLYRQFPDMIEALNAAKKANTTVKQFAAKNPKVMAPKLRTKPLKRESLEEGIGDKLKEYLSKVSSYITSKLSRYDNTLADVTQRLNAATGSKKKA